MGTGAIVGITIGSLITAVVVFALLIYVLKLWLRGPTLGSDQRKNLDGKVVAITGKKLILITVKFKDSFQMESFPVFLESRKVNVEGDFLQGAYMGTGWQRKSTNTEQAGSDLFSVI